MPNGQASFLILRGKRTNTIENSGLMAQESLDKLGFAASVDTNSNEDSKNAADIATETKPSKEKTGFIGGLTTKPLPKKEL